MRKKSRSSCASAQLCIYMVSSGLRFVCLHWGLAFTSLCRHYALRMRIYLIFAGSRCFPLAAIGVKMFIMKRFTAHRARYSIDRGRFRRPVGTNRFYKRSKYQPDRTINKGVIEVQNFVCRSPTLDCLFKPNPTFTNPAETGTNRAMNYWGHVLTALFSTNST